VMEKHADIQNVKPWVPITILDLKLTFSGCNEKKKRGRVGGKGVEQLRHKKKNGFVVEKKNQQGGFDILTKGEDVVNLEYQPRLRGKSETRASITGKKTCEGGKK